VLGFHLVKGGDETGIAFRREHSNPGTGGEKGVSRNRHPVTLLVEDEASATAVPDAVASTAPEQAPTRAHGDLDRHPVIAKAGDLGVLVYPGHE